MITIQTHDHNRLTLYFAPDEPPEALHGGGPEEVYHPKEVNKPAQRPRLRQSFCTGLVTGVDVLHVSSLAFESLILGGGRGVARARVRAS